MLYPEYELGQRDNTAGMVFALHVAHLDSISIIFYGPPCPPGMIPKCRVRSITSEYNHVSPKIQ